MPESTAAGDRIGDVLAGRFELITHLGSGGMGSVYRAHDRQLDDEVAIKLLHLDLNTSESLELLRSEVRLARRVTSTHVARIHELVDGGGAWFLTMEFVDGVSLEDMIAGGRLPVARIVEVLASICEGLAAVHAAGVVHGDVKPANILVARDGRVVLTDFGVARFAGSREDSREVVGTPAYMAPEQVTGAALDPRTDLYALGVVAYELVSGSPPFRGRNAIEVATARLFADPPPLGDKCPPVLAAAIASALSRDPDQRPASAADFRDALIAAPTTQPHNIESVDVVELYLEGRWLYRQFDQADRAVDIFAEARRRAPDSALIQAGYAIALARMWMLKGGDGEKLAEQAVAAVERAMELAPHLGEVEHARAVLALHTGDPVTAAAAMRQAISRAPGLTDAHSLAFAMLLEVGRLDAADRRLRTALRLDPVLERNLVAIRAFHVALGGDHSAADSVLAGNLAPGSMQLLLAARLAAYRRDRETLERVAAIGRRQPVEATEISRSFNAIAAVHAGDLDRHAAYALLPTRAVGMSARRRAVAMQLRAEIAGAFGDRELAVEALEVSDRDGGLIDVVWLDNCPLLDGLRSSPRFKSVRESVRSRADAVIAAFGLS